MDFIKTYFSAEKSESLIFVFIGIATILFSTYALVKWNDTFYKGFALPVILVGLIQVVVGATVYLRTDKQTCELEKLYQENKISFAQREASRMENVMKNFTLYEKIEVAFVVIGLVLILLTRAKDFWVGLGAGMLLQGAFMLTADVFAERRATIYISEINRADRM